MKIFIDINGLSSTKTGIENYIYFLVKNLLKSDKENDYFLYGPDLKKDPFPDVSKKINSFLLSRKMIEEISRRLHFPRISKEFSIYHLSSPALPFFFSSKTKLISTIHDVSFFYYPEFIISEDCLRYFIIAISEQIRRSDSIIAVSKNTAEDIKKAFSIPDEKIKVIYNGINHDHFFPSGNFKETMPFLPEKFILSLGTIEPRKNHLNLIKAFEMFCHKTGNKDLHLLVAGKKGWKYEPVFNYLENSKVKNLIVFIDYVPYEILPDLYRKALFFIYPSFYEGFGLPVLEAMACGCPVITSNTSSLPEVVGEAGLLVDPSSPEHIASSMERMVTEEDLRQLLSNKGIKRSKSFSWEKTARETQKVYQGMF